MKSQLVKWGNSLAVRIPKTVIEEAQMSEGENLELSVRNGTIAVAKAAPKLTLKGLLSKITPENVHDECDWGAPVGKEIW